MSDGVDRSNISVSSQQCQSCVSLFTCKHKSSANPLSENQAVTKEDDRGQNCEEFPENSHEGRLINIMTMTPGSGDDGAGEGTKV